MIEVVVPLPAVVPTDPYYLVAESTMTLATPDHVVVLGFDEQESSLHLLVSGFTGVIGQDLDVGDDGVLDTEPWAEEIEGFAFLFGSDPLTTLYGHSNVGIDYSPSSPILHAGRQSTHFMDFLPDDVQSDTPSEANGTGPDWWSYCWTSGPTAASMYCSEGTVPGSDLHLEVESWVGFTIGYILVGTGNGASNPVSISNGLLCLGTSPGDRLSRYNMANTQYNSVGVFSGGRLQNSAGTSSTGTGFDVPNTLPFLGDPAILVGQTYYFQCWYREPGVNQGSNFSDMVSVLF